MADGVINYGKAFLDALDNFTDAVKREGLTGEFAALLEHVFTARYHVSTKIEEMEAVEETEEAVDDGVLVEEEVTL